MFILMPVWKCLIYCCFVVSFESPTLFLFKIILAILVLLQFRVNFRISLSIYKEVSWDSDRDCTEPVNEVGEYYHLKDVKSSYSWRWGIFSTYLDFSFFFFLLSFHNILEALVYNLIVFNLIMPMVLLGAKVFMESEYYSELDLKAFTLCRFYWFIIAIWILSTVDNKKKSKNCSIKVYLMKGQTFPIRQLSEDGWKSLTFGLWWGTWVLSWYFN